MRDVACAGYDAGCNTLFFAQDSMGGDSYSMENARTHMMERLSFSNDVGAKYEGLDRYACRDALWADMEAEGLVLKVEDHTQRVRHTLHPTSHFWAGGPALL